MGTVFKIDPSGTETVLYSFSGGIDGANPYAGLAMDGADDLYGTTENGGASNSGTVFKIDTSGNETVLYRFTGGTDGAFPSAGLISAAGSPPNVNRPLKKVSESARMPRTRICPPIFQS